MNIRKLIRYCYGINTGNRTLSGIYAFRGDKLKAYENLNRYNQRQITGFWEVMLIKNDPLLKSIRDNSEFQKIVKDMEVKYQAEHKRVRKWLESQGSL